MSLSLDEVRTRVAQYYPDVKRVDDNTLCFSKRYSKDTPFAIYYLDVAKDLPATEEEIRRYVERVVGSQYFEGTLSLQWNNYFYFVRDAQSLSADKARTAKQIIEGERTYARKFVIDEEALDFLLRPGVFKATGTANQVDVTSRWTAVLKQPHLIEAVFGNYTLADRVKLIVGEKNPPTQHSDAPDAAIGPVALLPQLSKFKMTAYRPCLRGRVFEFQDVNLLFGVNGSGKTSALEAIELYYCGKHTKRNAKDEEPYEFEVQVRNEKPKKITHKREPKVFRNRNQLWYGVREQRRSHLYDSFGRFNFLNTDAAVDLARAEDENIDEDLARLLVGSDAAMIWQVIGELFREVNTELRRERDSQSQADQELELLQKRLAESKTVKTESDSLRTALLETLRRNQWTIEDHDLESGAGELVEQLSKLLGVAQQAVHLSWVDSPVTLDKCEQYATAVREVVNTHAPTVKELESLQARQAQLTDATTRSRKATTLAEELSRLVEAGVARRVSELATQRGIVTRTISLLAGIDDETVAVVTKPSQNLSVTKCHDSAVQSRTAAEASLKDAKRESEQFARIRERSVVLAQQLRGLATEIIGDGLADECPLCHTRFAPGELARHMSLGVDEHVEAAAQKLLAQVARLDSELREATGLELATSRIVHFCNSVRLPANVSLRDALSKLTETQATLNEARSRSEVLTSEIQSLNAQGLSLEQLNLVRSQITALGFNEPQQSQDGVSSLKTAIEESLRVSSAEMESAADVMAQLRMTLDVALRPLRSTTDEPRGALAELEERRVTTQEICSQLNQFLSRFSWQRSRPIAEWIVEAETVRAVAAKLQTALGAERVAAKTLSETIRRRDHLEALKEQLAIRIARLDEAHSAIEDIEKDHSLEIVTRSALQDNRTGIETIFAQIHSPAEFAGIDVDGKGWRLNRKIGNEKVPLTRISTGQRAAFALAVFLAQNAQLMAGPRVILIDDPIAHVDDLNSLSFLDYLREIALEGTRQIFFATASDKLASLFERKFDFLGEQFQRFNLTRAIDV